MLKVGGRGIVLSYHSGEDKIIKRILRELAGLDISNSNITLKFGMRKEYYY